MPDEDELELSEEDLEPLDAGEELRGDARALLTAREAVPARESAPLLTDEELEADLSADAHALLSGKGPEPGARRSLLTEEELEDDIQADARALLAGENPDPDGFRPLVTEGELEMEMAADAGPFSGRMARRARSPSTPDRVRSRRPALPGTDGFDSDPGPPPRAAGRGPGRTRGSCTSSCWPWASGRARAAPRSGRSSSPSSPARSSGAWPRGCTLAATPRAT